MKTRIFTLFIFATLLLVIASAKLEAVRTIFFADFDSKGIPDISVNDPKSWKPENPGTQWQIADFPANKTKGLKQVAEGCGTSGFTPFPDPQGNLKNWRDGVIQVDLGWGDDDSWGIMFRRTAVDKGYFAFFGFTETQFLILMDLAQGCGMTGKCLDENGCENNPGKVIKQVPHNLPNRDQTNNTSYTARISAQGPDIKIWYGLTADFPKNPLEPVKKFASMIEVEDSTYTKGSVGIWHESMSNSFIDNVIVYGGLAVDPQGKTALTWGALKARLE